MEKTLESPLDSKEIQSVHPKGIKSWIFTGRTEDETAILWSPDVKNWLILKEPDARKDWRREEKGTTEDEMAGWHCRFDGYEFEQAPGVGDGQGRLACCSPWHRRVGHNWTKLTFNTLKVTSKLNPVRIDSKSKDRINMFSDKFSASLLQVEIC